MVDLEGGPSKVQVAILSALASFPQGLNREQISLLTGRKARGGSWWVAMKGIVDNGWALDDGDTMSITPVGAALVPNAEPVPRDQIIARWRKSLPAPAREVLDVLIENQDRSFSSAELGRLTGRKPRGGSWWVAMSRLRETSIAVEVNGDELQLNPDLAMAPA